MAKSLADEIGRAIDQAGGLYHRLVILVAPSGAGKTAALQEVHSRTGAPLININLELSCRMLELTARQRALQFPRLLADIVNTTSTNVVLVDNTEVLFDVTLKQDPLRVLQGISRNRTVVAAWNGSVENQHLIYATLNHPEFRRYPLHDVLVVTPEEIA